MSRLKALHIPFSNGATDEVNPKVLPNGIFSDVTNGRTPQQAGLRLRRGWRPLVMKDLANNTTLVATDLYSYGASLVALVPDATSVFRPWGRLATLTESNAARPWVLNADVGIPPTTQLRAIGNIPDFATKVDRASAAVTSDGVYGCVVQCSDGVNAVFRVFRMATDETVAYSTTPDPTTEKKVVSLGTKFGLLDKRVTANGLNLYILDPSATAPGWTLTVTGVGGTFTGMLWWDAAVATATAPTHLHLVIVKSTGDVVYIQTDLIGAVTVAATTLTGLGTCQTATLATDEATAVVAGQNASTNAVEAVSLTASTGAVANGPTSGLSLQEDGVNDVLVGSYCVGYHVGGYVTFAWQAAFDGAPTADRFITYVVQIAPNFGSLSTLKILRGGHLVGGQIYRGNSGAVGVMREQDHTTFYADAVTALGAISGGKAPWFEVDVGVGTDTSVFGAAPFWPGVAPTGDALVLTPRDVTLNATGTLHRTATVRAVRVQSTERRPAVELAGALYITGASGLTQWVGAPSDVGMQAPSIDTVVASNGSGTMANGTYHYRALLRWTDEAGRTHRSAISGAASGTLSGANDTFTIRVYEPETDRRNSNLITNPVVELYRTEAGPGELFYLVSTTATDINSYGLTTITDGLPDASIVGSPLLPTQNEVSATSGVLEFCRPRASAFVAATKRRLICGSADTSYQFSQVTFPETQVWFAEPGIVGDPGQAYLDDVDAGPVTGVATLDEVVYVGTSQRIYVTGGAGPNLAGVGEFSPPAALPTDVGFFNAQSILETSEGLWFLGSQNTMYLLQRGTTTPVLNRAVQDHLTDTVVGCGYDHQDNIAAWAMAGSSPKLIIRQLDTKQWFTDPLPFTPIALHSHLGHLYAIASDGVVWRYDSTAFGDGTSGSTAVALRATTGAIQPFDIAGWGRLAVLEVLGEYEADAVLGAEISYDDGATWTSLGTHTITGLSAGATFQRQFYPARQRGGRFRVRLTMTPSVSTTEGCRLPGLTVYYVLKSGQTRLPSASRR